MRTKQQERSAFALDQIEEEFGMNLEKTISNFIVGTPTMVLNNGLGQTMAFLLSKGGGVHVQVFQVIRRWLAREIPALATADNYSFLKQLAVIDQNEYLWAQQETLKILEWLKRYARAFEKKKDEHGGD